MKKFMDNQIRQALFNKIGTNLNLYQCHSKSLVSQQVTFYVTKLISDGLYAMIEIGRIDVPHSLRELMSYLVHVDDVLNVVNAFNISLIVFPCPRSSLLFAIVVSHSAL
ncbi:unnamed protein product [Absidia cylindrospora]